MTLALTCYNPVGERMITLTFGTTNFSEIITGLIMLMASWIASEEQKLKTDVQLTI